MKQIQLLRTLSTLQLNKHGKIAWKNILEKLESLEHHDELNMYENIRKIRKYVFSKHGKAECVSETSFFLNVKKKWDTTRNGPITHSPNLM